ncbi:MAG: hypothetical protein EXR28_03910 [Betaproteobacteria bacterium]|nr:hypothetical protein [Betaproteobacteria bacterium]
MIWSGARICRVRAIPGVRDTLLSGIKSGPRYARHSPPMRALIGGTFFFSLCASGLWVLLPVIAGDQLSLDAGGFGMLPARFGIGAVVWVLGFQRHLPAMPLNTLVIGGHAPAEHAAWGGVRASGSVTIN